MKDFESALLCAGRDNYRFVLPFAEHASTAPVCFTGAGNPAVQTMTLPLFGPMSTTEAGRALYMLTSMLFLQCRDVYRVGRHGRPSNKLQRR